MPVRYLSLTDSDRKEMMHKIGIKDITELYPAKLLKIADKGFGQSDKMDEASIYKKLSEASNKNLHAKSCPFFLGAGCYHHYIPSAVSAIAQRSEFLTSYTPYQPEMSQGTLRYIYDFQTIVTEITGMDIANASMYDGATSLAEAVNMARIVTKKTTAIALNELHPHYKETVNTYAKTPAEHLQNKSNMEDLACIIVQLPDFHGEIPDLKKAKQLAVEKKALLIVCVTEILALGLIPAPTEADVVCGDGSSLGMSMGFGGPHIGIFACKQEFMRKIPGRLCGKTTDCNNKEAYTLTLNAREQHIRREKATSNICTNQSLAALCFTIHATLLGSIGFKKLAKLNHERACIAADELSNIPGVKVVNKTFFNEFVIALPTNNSTKIFEKLSQQDIVPGYALPDGKMLIAVTEMNDRSDIKKLCNALKKELK